MLPKSSVKDIKAYYYLYHLKNLVLDLLERALVVGALDDELVLLELELGPVLRHHDAQQLVLQPLRRDHEVQQRHLPPGDSILYYKLLFSFSYHGSELGTSSA